MIILKNEKDLEKMAHAGAIVKETLALAERIVADSMTTFELNREIDKFICSCGAKPSFKGYHGYPAASCISVNNVVVHGIPSKKTVIHEGDIVSVDVGAYVDGFHGDAARTFMIGKVCDEAKQLVEVTKECFFLGAEKAVKGNRLGDISNAVEEHAKKYGYGVVRDLVGHGIGKDMHEDPEVPNFGKAGHGVRLMYGMVLAIEPMINLGTASVEFSRLDGWTCTTKDGSLSAHYENTVAITPNGPKILTL